MNEDSVETLNDESNEINKYKVLLKQQLSNFSNDYTNIINNKLLAQIFDIIDNGYEKKKVIKESHETSIESAVLSNETMAKNLNSLIPDRSRLDVGRKNNKVDEFVVLLDEYVNSSNFEFKALDLSMDDMIKSLVLLIKQKKNSSFIKLLNIYMSGGFDINYRHGYWKFTLLHWCIHKRNLSLLRYLISNYNSSIDFNVSDKSEKTPYELSMYKGYYNMGSLLLVSSLGVNLGNSIKLYSDNNLEVNSVSKLFLYYLKKNCNMNNTFDMIMKLLEKTLICLIKDKKCFSKYLLKIIFDYNINKSNTINNGENIILNTKTNKLWMTIKDKLSSVLNINTLYYEKVDWYWFKNYLLNTNIWLLGTDKNDKNKLLYNELLQIVKTELKKQENTLSKNMKPLINKSSDAWYNICNFTYVNNKYSLMRQDVILYGIKSLYTKQDLNEMNMTSDDNNNTSIMLKLNDYNNYLSKLIMLGHKLNNNFISSVKTILDDFIQNKQCYFVCGPVKTLQRCTTKAQLDYHTNKYPTSACVIDIIRGSVTFNNLEDYYSGMTSFIERVNDPNIKHNISDIIRVKNGFNKSYKKHLESKTEEKEEIDFIPTKYLDIKLNLVISNNNESIVGELQFLLEPMLDNKKKNHELYEITRLDAIILHSKKNLASLNNPTKQLQVAIDERNKNKVAKIIIFNNINDININEKGDDKNKTPLFLQSMKKESSFYLVFKYFKEIIDYNKNTTLVDFILSSIGYIKDEVQLGHLVSNGILNDFLDVTDDKKRNPLMVFLMNRKSSLFSVFVNNSDTFMINFSSIDVNGNNLFHYIFQYCNFNDINFDLLIQKYQLFKKTNNISDDKLLFNKGENGQNVFHKAFKHNKSFSFQMLSTLEMHLKDIIMRCLKLFLKKKIMKNVRQ